MKSEKVFAWTIAGTLLLCLLIVQTLQWFSLDPLQENKARDDRREAQPQQPAPSSPAKESVLNPQSNLAALPFDEASETTETPQMPTQIEDSEVNPSGVVGGMMPNEEPVIDLKAAGVIPDDQLPPLDDEAETALQREVAEQEAAMRAAMEDGNIDPSGVSDGAIPQDFSVLDSGATGVGPP